MIYEEVAVGAFWIAFGWVFLIPEVDKICIGVVAGSSVTSAAVQFSFFADSASTVSTSNIF